MAQSREVLILEDQFTQAFTQYLSLAQQSNAASVQLQVSMQSISESVRLMAGTYQEASAQMDLLQTVQSMATSAAMASAAVQEASAGALQRKTAETNEFLAAEQEKVAAVRAATAAEQTAVKQSKEAIEALLVMRMEQQLTETALRGVAEAQSASTGAVRLHAAGVEAAVCAEHQKAVVLEASLMAQQRNTSQTNAAATAERAVESQARAAASATEQFAASNQAAAGAAGGMASKLKDVAAKYISIQGIRNLAELSDTFTQINTRLELMTGSAEAAAAAQDQIYAAAMRSRVAYTDMASTVSKMGTLAGSAFTGTPEIVAFAEQINKLMTLSGASTAEAQEAMLQLTQAMSSGVLHGEELNSIIKQTPAIAQTIAQYMGMTTEEMLEQASQGGITSEMFKNAVLSASEETNRRFEQMPRTWSEIWNQCTNVALFALQPVLSGIRFLADHIEVIGPLVLGAAAAFAVFQVAANWTSIATAAITAYRFAVNILLIGFGILTGNTAAASAAMFTFNSALLASPISWMIMGLALAIGVLYAGVAAYNHFADASVSATGMVAGTFLALGALILNCVIIPLQNIFAHFANFVGNVFSNPVAAAKILFWDMATTVLGYVSSVAHGIEELINRIPGMEVNLTSGIDRLYHMAQGASQDAKEASGWIEYVKAWEPVDLSKAYQKGYDWGANLNWFDTLKTADIGETGGLGGTVPDLEETNGILGDLLGSVGGIEKSVSLADEDLKSLVDLAERRYVTNVNLTSQAPVIQIQGQNTGNTAADMQALVNAIRDMLAEQLAAGSLRSTSNV